jgi:predicted amidohydrolase
MMFSNYIPFNISPSANFLKPWLPKTESPSILLVSAKLVDPVEGKVHPNVSVHVGGGLIKGVSLENVPLGVPSGTKTIDLEGRYICPGLADSYPPPCPVRWTSASAPQHPNQ